MQQLARDGEAGVKRRDGKGVLEAFSYLETVYPEYFISTFKLVQYTLVSFEHILKIYLIEKEIIGKILPLGVDFTRREKQDEILILLKEYESTYAPIIQEFKKEYE